MIVKEWKCLKMNGNDWERMEMIGNEWKLLWMNGNDCELRDNIIMNTHQYIPKLYGMKHYPWRARPWFHILLSPFYRPHEETLQI